MDSEAASAEPDESGSTSNVTRDENIVRGYLDGGTVTDLARQHHLSRSRVRQVLDNHRARPIGVSTHAIRRTTRLAIESQTPEALKPPALQANALKPLTLRQKEVLDFIVEYHARQGFSPAYRDIGEKFGISSTNGVSEHLTALEKKGYIRRGGVPGQNRSIQVVHLEQDPALSRRRPVVMAEREKLVFVLATLENIRDWIPAGVCEQFQRSTETLRHVLTADLPRGAKSEGDSLGELGSPKSQMGEVVIP